VRWLGALSRSTSPSLMPHAASAHRHQHGPPFRGLGRLTRGADSGVRAADRGGRTASWACSTDGDVRRMLCKSGYHLRRPVVEVMTQEPAQRARQCQRRPGAGPQ
jgi:hypothetical protein